MFRHLQQIFCKEVDHSIFIPEEPLKKQHCYQNKMHLLIQLANSNFYWKKQFKHLSNTFIVFCRQHKNEERSGHSLFQLDQDEIKHVSFI